MVCMNRSRRQSWLDGQWCDSADIHGFRDHRGLLVGLADSFALFMNRPLDVLQRKGNY